MSLMCEIEKLMNVANSSISYRVINLGGKTIYVEGIKSVVNLAENEMIFQLKKQAISVCGTNLKIKYLDKTTCVLEGEIFKVEIK